MTNIGTDIQDLYIIQEQDQNTYWYNGQLLNYTIRQEVIQVSGSDPVKKTLFVAN